jgi:FkbM family methyltransferase
MQRLGTNYGGWLLPKDLKLHENSVVYSAGVGEDISFDMLLSDKFNCNIVLIDPTKRAKIHYEEVKHYYENIRWKMSGDIQKDYYGIMYPLKPNLNKVIYVNKGLWDKKTKLKFYKQNNETYVSQSLIEGMFGDKYDEVEVDILKNLMEENNHEKIDILKLDIEGAEIKVLNTMLDNNIFPTYICVEFDLYLKKKDKNNETQTVIKRLEKNYKVIANENGNVTFKLN